MSQHKKDQHKDQGKDQPLRIHLGDDEEEHDDAEARDGDIHDAGEYDDGEVEVIRPHARGTGGTDSRGRGLRNQPAPEEEEELPPSKTKIKKQMHELRDLGKELTELSKDQLAQLDIPENLRDAISEIKNINKFGARRRQIQYIGKLMREVETAPILSKLDAWKGKSQQHTAYMHLLERWRDRLMENDSALTELLAAHPHADAQHLRALIRNAHRETLAGKPPKSYREIFQALKDIIPETQ